MDWKYSSSVLLCENVHCKHKVLSSKPSPTKKKKVEILSENNQSKGWDVAQVVDVLPNKNKPLNSNPSTAKKKKNLLFDSSCQPYFLLPELPK
jgi:hypothetical protein